MKTYAIASGYFDPLHVGHIEYFTKAQHLGDTLIVIVNNDKQAQLKKEKSFMQEQDRVKIISTLKPVQRVVLSIDSDRSVCETLKQIASQIREEDSQAEILFVNGGDRFANEIPESTVCTEYNIKLVDGLGDKIRSSSELVTTSAQ